MMTSSMLTPHNLCQMMCSLSTPENSCAKAFGNWSRGKKKTLITDHKTNRGERGGEEEEVSRKVFLSFDILFWFENRL